MMEREPQGKDFIKGLIVCIIMSMTVFALAPAKVLASNGEHEENGGGRPKSTTGLALEQTDWANIEGTNASIRYREFSAGLEWRFLTIDVNHREYEWKNSAGFSGNAGDDPWDTLTQIGVGLQYLHMFNERWGVWPKVATIAGFEDTISSQSWTYNPQVVGFYMPVERVAIYAGMGMLYHPADSEIYPVIGITWNLSSGEGLSGAVGFPETMVRYGLNERVGLKMDFVYDIRYYHLAEGKREGFVKIEDFITGLKIEYEAVKGLVFSLGGRVYFGRELTIFDHGEHELTAHDVGVSTAYLLGVDYRF